MFIIAQTFDWCKLEAAEVEQEEMRGVLSLFHTHPHTSAMVNFIAVRRSSPPGEHL